MIIEHLLYGSLQAQLASVFDLLPSDNELVQLLKKYLVAGKVEGKSRKTIYGYSDFLSRFILFALDHEFPQRIQDLTSSHIRLFLLSLQERGLTPATINVYYRALHSFAAWLVAEGFLDKSPLDTIKSPKVPKQVIKPFTIQDIRALLDLCSGNRLVDLRNRAIILTFIDTGLRLFELAGIQWQQIDFGLGCIPVMGKGGKGRIVRIGTGTQKALLKYLTARTDTLPCLWVTQESKPLSQVGIQITMRRLSKRAGIIDAKPGVHTYRHTAAINYLRNGGDQFTLQIMLGHSSLEMTRRYVSSLGAEDMMKVHRKASPVDNLKL